LSQEEARDLSDGAIQITDEMIEARPWRPQTSFRLVAVEWEDSQRPLPSWQWLDEYQLPDAVRCISVGFLVAETDDALAIAPNLGDLEHPRVQGAGIIRIPRSAVRRIADL
jgi:hypothetical protein